MFGLRHGLGGRLMSNDTVPVKFGSHKTPSAQ